MLTTSPVDGEALAAIRKANSLLRAAGGSWESFLPPQRPAAPPPPPPRHQRETHAEKCERAFRILRADIDRPNRSGFWAFIASLEAQFQARGKLSPKQKSALFKAAKI